jgi:hypothetical protein
MVGRILSYLQCDPVCMKHHSTPDTHCDACGKPLYRGQPTVCFIRNIEHLEASPSHPQGAITVIDSQELISLCGACGNRFSVERATAVLKAAVQQSQFIRN